MSISDGITFDSWSRLGDYVSVVANSSAWWLGDWLVYGQERFSNRYRRCIEESSLDYQTLRNYAWVARNVPLSRRRDGLSFQHHAEVASLPADEQTYWLGRALEEKWSRNALRAQIRAGRAAVRAATSQLLLRLRVPQGREEVWRKAAQEAGLDFTDWAARELDRAARLTAVGAAEGAAAVNAAGGAGAGAGAGASAALEAAATADASAGAGASADRDGGAGNAGGGAGCGAGVGAGAGADAGTGTTAGGGVPGGAGASGAAGAPTASGMATGSKAPVGSRASSGSQASPDSAPGGTTAAGVPGGAAGAPAPTAGSAPATASPAAGPSESAPGMPSGPAAYAGAGVTRTPGEVAPGSGRPGEGASGDGASGEDAPAPGPSVTGSGDREAHD
ncbi:LmbU family transcriptional regulator [Streptomyces albus]|uniref:LmbU family transcriptional regulator n=1 Tax=Streptomyces albus TaxID=1888 RepID=UPI0033E53748